MEFMNETLPPFIGLFGIVTLLVAMYWVAWQR